MTSIAKNEGPDFLFKSSLQNFIKTIGNHKKLQQ